LADYVGDLIDRDWKRARSSGMVSDAMLGLESAVENFLSEPEPVYSEMEAGA
jgi:hypothetical protein